MLTIHSHTGSSTTPRHSSRTRACTLARLVPQTRTLGELPGLTRAKFIYAGKHAALTIGNILPLHSVPEGTVLTNVEEKAADRGALGRTSGNYVTVIGHNPDEGKTRVKLPSGAKKVLPSSCRGMVGIVAGGGRTDKPLMKASRAKHKVRDVTWTLLNRD
jgi:large subunit ribosomal protein L8e